MPSAPQHRPALVASMAATALTLGFVAPAAADTGITYFTPGDLVISTVSGSALDTASAITLQQFSLGTGGTTATAAGSLVLPQTSSGANAAISGEYGSASEGILQVSANGQYLTMMGYGVNAATFNAAPTSTYGTAALGQTTSLTNSAYATVPRVVALVGTTGTVDTTTALTGVFNGNNPRSAATVDGTSFYVSGQGVTGDGTGGVFYATKGATTATAINANTTTPTGANTVNPATGTETRTVSIVNTGSGNTLVVSRDYSPSGTPNDSTDLRTLTNASGALPTSSTGLQATRLLNNGATGTGSVKGGNTSSIDLVAALDNNVNSSRNGKFVYLSPAQFFFANATTMYVADTGSPKNGGANAAALGEGGLQKWSLVNGVWTLDYDLYAGLNLVNNANVSLAGNTTTTPGVTGLFGLTGEVVGNNVELFATSYGLNELSPSYLYEITDSLMATSASQVSGESFATLYSAPLGTSIRGVSLAPAPEPASIAVFGVGLVAAAAVRRRPAKA